MQQPEVQLTGAKSSSQVHKNTRLLKVSVCVFVCGSVSPSVLRKEEAKKKHTKDEDGFGDICH